MTLVKNLRQKLAESEASSQRHDLQVADADSGSAVTIAIVQRDAMSCLAHELCVRRPAPAGMDMRQWAERITARVTSLLQPLQVLEIDTQRHQALLRTAPAQHQDNLTYFEVILEGTTSAAVRRYQVAGPQADAAPRRAQVAFALTHEALLKLVDDLLV
jgi:hypothetical protein